MRSTRCLDLVHAICESELSHLSYPNSKRTARPCYTFQKEKKTPIYWSRKRLKPEKTCGSRFSFYCWRKKSWGKSEGEMKRVPILFQKEGFRKKVKMADNLGPNGLVVSAGK